jgi:hypothetical protein
MPKIPNIFKEQPVETQQAYVQNLQNIYGETKTMNLMDVDFSKPWWWILTKLRFKIIFLWSVGSANGIFWILFPILVVKCLESGDFNNFIYLVAARILVMLLSLVPYRYEPEIFMQLHWSIFTSATKFFLSVDPLNHSTRSTGTIISKVQRGKDSFGEFLGIITWEILPMLISFVTVVIVFLSVDLWLGLASLISLVGCIALTVFFQWFNSNFTRKVWIDTEDKTKAFGIENLQQMQFIRSTFATIPQLNTQISMTKILMSKNRAIWLAYIWFYHIPLIVYYISITWIGYIVFTKIGSGTLTLAAGTGLMGTYFLGSNNISEFGEKAKRLTEKVTDIRDLWDFIRGFGKQTYPVLERDNVSL